MCFYIQVAGYLQATTHAAGAATAAARRTPRKGLMQADLLISRPWIG